MRGRREGVIAGGKGEKKGGELMEGRKEGKRAERKEEEEEEGEGKDVEGGRDGRERG